MRKSLAALLAALVAASGLILAPASPALAAPPKRNDGLGEPIYWVHGIQISATGHPKADCKQWDTAIKAYRARGATAEQNTVAFYKGDKNCNSRIGSYENGVSIKELGRKLAWDIYNRYTKNGRSVDAVGHSMGGLIIRAAITGVQKKTKNWPPALYIEDVVTIGTPHTGTNWARSYNTQQAKDMRPGSSFLKWLNKNPQSTQGTDWTLIGSEGDKIVPWKSSVSTSGSAAGYLAAGHKVVFHQGQGLTHTAIYKKASGKYKSRYWNKRAEKSGWITQTKGESPIVVARNANYSWRLW
ncbi:DUF7379 domain-containing protein [Actinoplanes derwentensis]|uniref:Putative serine esterase n=1 Tax=Actinoplanes derwentensis TaxID=113562 RepID=A0A1H2CX05_9ACTN|nr:alpha/beta hydrolase [Actinoplanes derwentensis]GID88374.1 hypothetical protein Ade03nite_72980 [Actinoplanes derwentensis]SDT74742.1 Putative serine esterase [Actinoplanes derwentensis]